MEVGGQDRYAVDTTLMIDKIPNTDFLNFSMLLC